MTQNLLTLTNKESLEKDFYANPFRFSYSSLNKLLYAPQLFYRDYILKQKDQEITPSLLQGKAIHCLLLDDGSFDKQFILLPGNFPSDNPKKILDKLYEYYIEQKFYCDAQDGEVGQASPLLTDYSDRILELLKEINLYQSLKTDPQRLEKINTESNQEYFNYLIDKGNRDVIDIPTYDYCLSIVERLKEHPDVNALLFPEITSDTIQIFNELPIECDLENMPFGIKGILDNLTFDWDNKIIRINDLKTTSKSLTDFKETVEFYNLWLQAAIYIKLVEKEFLINNELDLSEWKMIFTFIVIDKYKEIYAFEVSDETMGKWKAQAEEVLLKAKWHYENKRFDLPYELATNKILL